MGDGNTICIKKKNSNQKVLKNWSMYTVMTFETKNPLPKHEDAGSMGKCKRDEYKFSSYEVPPKSTVVLSVKRFWEFYNVIFVVFLSPSRGPNRYTRKWDDEDAYGKQTGKAFRPTRRQKPLPVKREEYDAEFPELDRQFRAKAKSRERRKSPVPKSNRNHDVTRSEGEMKYKEELRRTPPRKFNSDYVVERTSRSFTKRIPTAVSSIPSKVHHNDAQDAINDSQYVLTVPKIKKVYKWKIFHEAKPPI